MEWLERNGGNWCWEFETSRIWEQLAAVFKGGPSCRASLPGWERPGGVARVPGRSPTWTSIKLLILLVIISHSLAFYPIMLLLILLSILPCFYFLNFESISYCCLRQGLTQVGGRRCRQQLNLQPRPPFAQTHHTSCSAQGTRAELVNFGHSIWDFTLIWARSQL